MSDTDDQNTPKDDFAQSIDDISEDVSAIDDSAEQSPDINGENDASSDADEAMAGSADAPGSENPGASGHSDHGDTGVTHDLSTLSGRLEKKIAEVKSVLWEKEAMQLQYVFQGGRIREEYYKRWKVESNIFAVMASRLQKRLDKERERIGKV